MRLDISGRAIIGSKEPQQDSWRVLNGRAENLTNAAGNRGVVGGDGTLVIVADGIGGYAGGEVASALACDAFGSAFFAGEGAVSDRLRRALEAANAAIAEEKRRSPALRDMGCTLIAVHFDRDKMTFVSVGDSLLLRSRDDEIHRVNFDHSYFEYLDRQVLGSNDPQRWSVAVRDVRQRASLTLAVTGADLVSSEFGHRPQIAVRPLFVDDVIIVASDGIETLELVQLQNFMHRLRPSGAPGIADGLIGAVDGIGASRNYQDNTTIVVITASEGAGVTRVLTAGPAAAPVGGAGVAARLFSGVSARSKTLALAGVVLFGIVTLVLLYVFVATGDRPAQRARDLPPAGASEQSSSSNPEQSGVSREARSRTNPDTPAPVDPGAEKGAAPQTAQPPGGPPSDARDPAQRQADRGNDAQPAAGVPTPADMDVSPKTKGPTLKNQPAGLAVKGGRPLGKTETASSTKCFQRCLEDMLCVAYTARPGNRCDLFASPGKIVDEPDAVSGTKYSN